MGRFDDLMLSGDIVRGMLSVCVRLFVISFVLMIAFSVVLKRMNAKYRIPVMWYFSLPKFFISVFAILLVFCFDYEEKHLMMFHIYDMTAATFLLECWLLWSVYIPCYLWERNLWNVIKVNSICRKSYAK